MGTKTNVQCGLAITKTSIVFLPKENEPNVTLSWSCYDQIGDRNCFFL